MEGKIKIGPVGHNPGGKPVVTWDEGSHNGIISQIFISHGDDDGIYSIQFQFLLDDKFVLSDRHGPNTGRMFDAILLNCPHEYITGISGTLPSSYSGGNPNIKSLKFTTNTNEYGPFGSSSNSYHNSDKNFVLNLGKLSQFGGFFGGYTVSGLHYIGVYLQPTTPKPKTRKSNAEDLESNIVFGL